MTVSSDPDLGEHIHTKNRYRVTTIINEKNEKLAFATPEGELRYRKLKIVEADSLRPVFEKYQPDVFASDGIPVVIKNENGKSQIYDDTNTFLFLLGPGTIGILPACLSKGLRRTYVIETVGGQKVNQRIVIDMSHVDVANNHPFFIWIWLALQKETEVVDGHRSFAVSGFNSLGSFDGRASVVWSRVCAGKNEMRVLTYAIAARLKKLEDENRVSGGAK